MSAPSWDAEKPQAAMNTLKDRQKAARALKAWKAEHLDHYTNIPNDSHLLVLISQDYKNRRSLATTSTGTSVRQIRVRVYCKNGNGNLYKSWVESLLWQVSYIHAHYTLLEQDTTAKVSNIHKVSSQYFTSHSQWTIYCKWSHPETYVCPPYFNPISCHRVACNSCLGIG